MARYIDADKAKLNLLSLSQSITHSANISANDIAMALPLLLDNEPTADVQEIQHAFWKYDGISTNSLWHVYHCSHCSGLRNTRTAYCPSCGAKMDQEERHDERS